MNVLDYLIQNKNTFVSGQTIADNLKMTRANVWKEIEKLRKQGIVITAQTRKGYQLTSYGTFISETLIKESVKEISSITILDTCTSTNDLAKNGTDDLYITHHQTAGRGRRGREFLSPAKEGIYFSLNLKPKLSIEEIPLITLCAAVAVRKTLQSYTNTPVGIKWLNDVYIDHKKISGILVEGDIELQTQTFNKIIVGIGINLQTTDTHTFAILQDYTEKEIDRNQIIIDILNTFFHYYNNLETVVEEYTKYSIVIGKTVIVDNKEYQAQSITPEGHLQVIDKQSNIHILNSGEISIKYEN